MNDQSRLLWRCRRGIREMDLLLETFMHRHYPSLSEHEKKLFEDFLNESDPDLLNWIMGRSEPGNGAYLPLLAKIKSPETDTNAG